MNAKEKQDFINILIEQRNLQLDLINKYGSNYQCFNDPLISRLYYEFEKDTPIDLNFKYYPLFVKNIDINIIEEFYGDYLYFNE